MSKTERKPGALLMGVAASSARPHQVWAIRVVVAAAEVAAAAAASAAEEAKAEEAEDHC
jgi:hypothetical protein